MLLCSRPDLLISPPVCECRRLWWQPWWRSARLHGYPMQVRPICRAGVPAGWISYNGGGRSIVCSGNGSWRDGSGAGSGLLCRCILIWFCNLPNYNIVLLILVICRLRFCIGVVAFFVYVSHIILVRLRAVGSIYTGTLLVVLRHLLTVPCHIPNKTLSSASVIPSFLCSNDISRAYRMYNFDLVPESDIRSSSRNGRSRFLWDTRSSNLAEIVELFRAHQRHGVQAL